MVEFVVLIIIIIANIICVDFFIRSCCFELKTPDENARHKRKHRKCDGEH